MITCVDFLKDLRRMSELWSSRILVTPCTCKMMQFDASNLCEVLQSLTLEP